MSSEDVSKLWKLGIGVIDDPLIWSRIPVFILEKEILRYLATSYSIVIKFSLVCQQWRTLLYQEYYSRIHRSSSLASPNGQGWFLQLFLIGQTTELFAALHHPMLHLWQQLPVQRNCSGYVPTSYLVANLDFVKADKGMLLLKKSYVDLRDKAEVYEEEWLVIESLTHPDNRNMPCPTRIPDMGWSITEANIFFQVSRSKELKDEDNGSSLNYKIIILAVDMYVNWFVSQVYDSRTKIWDIVKVARLDDVGFKTLSFGAFFVVCFATTCSISSFSPPTHMIDILCWPMISIKNVRGHITSSFILHLGTSPLVGSL